MQSGYVLDIGHEYRVEPNRVEEKIASNKKKSIKLADYLLDSGEIEAQKVIETIFPEVEADIFLSHSHRDMELAAQIAIDIEENKGLKVFIDSCAWGNSSELLRRIDDKYCKNEDDNIYQYHRRNQSTAHVHMILTTALQSMIFNTKKFMFLRSNFSIKTEDFIQNSSSTDSAWIHMELKFSELIHRAKSIATTYTVESYDSLHVIHEAPISHLQPVSVTAFEKWLHERGDL